MAEPNREKLNLLQQLLPDGLLVDAAWLRGRGYRSNLVAYYVQRGWLDAPARGVYRRPGAPLKWQQVVASLQNLLALPVHVGGLTALEIQGKGHFVRLGDGQPVHLYAPAALPGWLFKLPLQDRFIHYRARLFNETAGAAQVVPVPVAEDPARRAGPHGIGLTEIAWGGYDWPLSCSTLERAYLELLDEIVSHEEITHANLIMQGLNTLSPRRLKDLLAVCRSVKVKRLFFALAEHNRHPWLGEIDSAAFDLGKGKRQLAPGGKLHPKYLITLPQDLGDAY